MDPNGKGQLYICSLAIPNLKLHQILQCGSIVYEAVSLGEGGRGGGLKFSVMKKETLAIGENGEEWGWAWGKVK